MVAAVIVIEGVDGSGKSTLAKKIKNKLSQDSFKVKLIAFPSIYSTEGIKAQQILGNIDKTYIKEELIGYLIKDMRLAYNQFKSSYDILIFDRGWVSTIVYQEIGLNCLLKTKELGIPFVITRLVYMDTPNDIIKERIASRQESNTASDLDIKNTEHDRLNYYKERYNRVLSYYKMSDYVVKTIYSQDGYINDIIANISSN